MTSSPSTALRLFLVDDHQLFRAGVRHEIDGQLAHMNDKAQRVEIVGEAGDVVTAVSEICQVAPDVVLVDVHIPDGGGPEVIRRVHASQPGIRFLALSVSDAAEDVIGTIRAGARGYVTKTISTPELLDAIAMVAAGDAVFSPRLAGFVLDAFAQGSETVTMHLDPELDQLTSREREVLRLIARGYAYKEIARELYISVKTVETHVSAVLRKLQLTNRYQLTRWALERRLVPPEP